MYTESTPYICIYVYWIYSLYLYLCIPNLSLIFVFMYTESFPYICIYIYWIFPLYLYLCILNLSLILVFMYTESFPYICINAYLIFPLYLYLWYTESFPYLNKNLAYPFLSGFNGYHFEWNTWHSMNEGIFEITFTVPLILKKASPYSLVFDHTRTSHY